MSFFASFMACKVVVFQKVGNMVGSNEEELSGTTHSLEMVIMRVDHSKGPME